MPVCLYIIIWEVFHKIEFNVEMAILEALSKSQFYASCYTLLDLEILCLKKEKKHVIKSCLFISKNKLSDTIRSLKINYL